MTMDNDVYDEDENVLLSPTPNPLLYLSPVFQWPLPYYRQSSLYYYLKQFKPIAVYQVVYNTTAIWELIYER